MTPADEIKRRVTAREGGRPNWQSLTLKLGWKK